MLKKITLAALLVVLLSGMALAQAAITGVVVDARGNPVAGATVMLKDRDTRMTVTTGRDGSFGFRDVDTGTYMLCARKRGEGGIRQVVEILRPTTYTFRLALERRCGGQGHCHGGGGGCGGN